MNKPQGDKTRKIESIGNKLVGDIIGLVAVGMGGTPSVLIKAIGEEGLLELVEECDKKIHSLISTSHKELIERVRKEVIGRDEVIDEYSDREALDRNELREEQRNLLSTIDKD